ncbi:MAG: hypothetical protein JSS28_09015 [Proteobacteria bacterium]|nr:hypothetical protein [Pseudomonadota bacterium]
MAYPEPMIHHGQTLPARLRRHRGLWALAFVVLLLKLTSATACLADGAGVLAVAASAQAVDAAPAATGTDPCVLGEAGACHCACPETVPLPATVASVPSALVAAFVPPALEPGIDPVFAASPLRPPIA